MKVIWNYLSLVEIAKPKYIIKKNMPVIINYCSFL